METIDNTSDVRKKNRTAYIKAWAERKSGSLKIYTDGLRTGYKEENKSKLFDLTEIKRCSRCNEDKTLDSYFRANSSKSGFKAECKSCSVKNHKLWRDENRNESNTKRRTYYSKNTTKIRENHKKYLSENKHKSAEYQKRSIDKRRKSFQLRMENNLRGRLRQALKGCTRRGSAVRDLGCSILELRIYLQNQFKPDMTWENWGKVWHIDHIHPLSRVDLTDREQLLKVCHYTNLQPLYAAENIRKSNLLPEELKDERN